MTSSIVYDYIGSKPVLMEVNETKHSYILKVMDSQKFYSTIIFFHLHKKSFLKKSDPRTENPEVHTYSECCPLNNAQ